MDEPVPIRRAAIGCLLIALAGLALALIVRPAIFSFSTPRDDSAVVVATASDVVDGPIRRDVLLTRSYGWPGEIDAGDGRVQLSVIVAPGAFAGVTRRSRQPARSATTARWRSSRSAYVDCEGRAWTLDGVPLESGLPPLDRFPVEVQNGSVTVDLTRTIDD